MGDDAIIGQFVPNRSGDVNVIYDGSYPDFNHVLNSLTLDASGTTGSVSISQTFVNSSMWALTEYIGTGGRNAIWNQLAGINRFGSGNLYLGFDAGSSGSYFVSGDALLAAANVFSGTIYLGYSGAGLISQNGGTVNTSYLLLAQTPGSTAQYNLIAGELNVACANCENQNHTGVGEIIGVSENASFVQSGGVHTIGSFNSGGIGIGEGSSYTLAGGTLHLKVGGGSAAPTGGLVINEGVFNLSGGTLMLTGSNVPTGALIRNLGGPNGNGVFNYAGGTLSFPNGGTVENTGVFTISVPSATVPAVTNSGLFHTMSATTIFTGTFSNNGQFLSTSPSRQIFASLSIGSAGYLQGGAGDVFEISRNLTNNSAIPASFSTGLARILLSGGGVTHRVAWPGADFGPLPSGYNNNFAVGVLQLSSGGSLILLDGDSTAGGAIYSEVLLLDDGLEQISSLSSSANISIYYDPNNTANGYLQGNTYPLNGGGVIAPVPGRTPPPDPTPTPRPGPAPATYVPLSPARMWDSRFGPGPTGQSGPGSTRTIQISSVGGVPATGATSVVLNVAAINPTSQTFATVWPTGEAQPLAANLNVPAGDVRPNLVIVKLGLNGQINVFNNAGNVDFAADVAGWYGDAGTDRYTPVSPARVWDTRSGPGPTGRIEAGGSRNLTVTGVGGVPATGVSAVVLNVAAVSPSARTFITAWPAGEARPLAANLNVPAGDVRPNLVIVKVGANGQVSFFNNAGDVDLVADVAGYFSTTGSAFNSVSPSRVWDTRSGPGPTGRVEGGGSRDLTVTGVGGVPATGVTAVVLNLAGVRPSAQTFATAWPTGETRPLAANLNVPANDVRPNLVIVKVGANGQVSFYNNSGDIDFVADVAGWFGAPGP